MGYGSASSASARPSCMPPNPISPTHVLRAYDDDTKRPPQEVGGGAISDDSPKRRHPIPAPTAANVASRRNSGYRPDVRIGDGRRSRPRVLDGRVAIVGARCRSDRRVIGGVPGLQVPREGMPWA